MVEDSRETIIGQKLDLDLDFNLPKLVFFVSSFCSKCMYNRKMIQKIVGSEHMIEIDIVNQTKLQEALQPRMAPTLVLLDSQQRVIFYEEGVLHDKTLQSLQLLLSRYLE